MAAEDFCLVCHQLANSFITTDNGLKMMLFHGSFHPFILPVVQNTTQDLFGVSQVWTSVEGKLRTPLKMNHIESTLNPPISDGTIVAGRDGKDKRSAASGKEKN